MVSAAQKDMEQAMNNIKSIVSRNQDADSDI